MKDEKNSDNKIKIINQNDNSKIRFLKGDIFHNVNNSESNEQEEIKIQRIQTFDKERRNKFTHIKIPTFRKINSLNISEENEINKFDKKIKIKNKNKIHLNKKEINFELNEKKINEDINNNNINFNNINKHEVKNETNNTKNNNNNKIIIKKQIPQLDMKQENVLNSNNINKNNNIENNNNKNKNDNNQKESNYNSIIKDFSKYEFANIEIRKQMEDFTYTNLNFHNKNNHNISLFAIYDGHNGKLVSEHLYKNFDKILLSNLEKTNYQIRKSLIDSFQQINSNFEKNPEAKNTGSTATVILIDNNNLYCANVGDSQCYYISKEKIIKLTKVHNCNDLKEVERIKKKME